MDGGTWQATVHGVAKSRTRLSNFVHFLGDESYRVLTTNIFGRFALKINKQEALVCRRSDGVNGFHFLRV